MTFRGGRLLVSRAQTVFDTTGNITDEAVKKQIQQFLAGFVTFIGAKT
jgi:chromate reductase, NAD(P)H dehydrogenase (quinone)